jgi:DNA modification methylase
MNKLYYGDNLDVLRESIAGESVDLIYLDPPFNSQATYNVLFRSPAGAQSQAQIEAFEDTWHWGQEAEDAFDQVLHSGNTNAADLLRAMRSFLGENDMMAYLSMMAIRLIELHRVLKPTGSLYLHCDPTASHYLKILLDGVFGREFFRNEIIWLRHNARSVKQAIWPRLHDVLLHYGQVGETTFHTSLIPSEAVAEPHDLVRGPDGKRYRTRDLTGAGTRTGETGQPWRGVNPTAKGRHWRVLHAALDQIESEGRIYLQSGSMPRERDAESYEPGGRLAVVGDVWPDIAALNSGAAERLGYPTQKPVSLLERIIAASSNEGEVVLDPFCGCGTAVHAAQKLARQWVGIDITHLAISLIERRLKDAFPGIAFEVHGTPKDYEGARDLALRDKYQFQWWALSLIDAQPYAGKKKGADSGVDGLIYFKADAKTTERVIVSVKGGEHVSVPMVRDLKGVLEREKAPIGIFLTLNRPTRPMEAEAAAAGFYESDFGRYPRLQIITVEDALKGIRPRIPAIDTGAAFRRAGRELRESPQASFDL